MNMSLVVVGLNHRVAPVDLRESFAVPADRLAEMNRKLVDAPSISEAMVLSTCNRVEFYAVPTDPDAVEGELERLLGSDRGLDPRLLASCSYVLRGEDALLHLMRVCASLDSLVVGEAQILGQVKDAARNARDAGTIGPFLDRVLQSAFSAAKEVRTKTAIAEATVSIGSVAVDLARRIFPSLDTCRVLMLGAGKMGQVTARALASAGVSRVYIASRTYARARELADGHGWIARDFAEVDDLLASVDVVITSTGASRPILGVKQMRAVVKRRRYKPLFIVDIAVPRDVAAGVGELDSVYLYNIDDLEQLSQANLAQRKSEAEAAEAIVAARLAELGQWQRTLVVKPVIAAIRGRAETITREALDKSFRRGLSELDEAQRGAVEAAVKAAVNKLLHPAMSALREQAAEGEGLELARAAERLYGVTARPPAVLTAAPSPKADGASAPAATPPTEDTE